ncbi:hypothetical protein MAHJHV45_47220 [Mycobacterium avium subsp. hominissuis]
MPGIAVTGSASEATVQPEPSSGAAAPATSLASSAAPLEGSGWTVASEAEPVTAMPGMPGIAVTGSASEATVQPEPSSGAAAAAKGAGAYGSGPRYGFKPIVMPKQVVV